jgi:hypothetical protein
MDGTFLHISTWSECRSGCVRLDSFIRALCGDLEFLQTHIDPQEHRFLPITDQATHGDWGLLREQFPCVIDAFEKRKIVEIK